MRNRRKKIAIVTSSLGDGGAERVSANLSYMFSQLGHDVHIISILNNISYSYKGFLLNLGKLKDQNDSFFGKIKRYKIFKDYLKNEKFDFVIDGRTRPLFLKEFLINKILYSNQKVIFMVHSYLIENYLPKNKILANLLYGKAHKFVAVSNEIKELLHSKYKLNQINFIPNILLDFNEYNKEINIQNLPKKFILYFGRVDDKVKNISLLINAYEISKLAKNDIFLVILGNGPDIKAMKKKVNSLGLGDRVIFHPFQCNPESIIKKALFSVLTSRFEGFPLALIESLSSGTPVVSVDCKSGPKEIIKNNSNGLLVKNHNPQLLSKALNKMIEDKKLYKNCCKNASNSVSHLSYDFSSIAWEALINES